MPSISGVTTESRDGRRDGPDGRPMCRMNGLTKTPSPAVWEPMAALMREYGALNSSNTRWASSYMPAVMSSWTAMEWAG